MQEREHEAPFVPYSDYPPPRPLAGTESPGGSESYRDERASYPPAGVSPNNSSALLDARGEPESDWVKGSSGHSKGMGTLARVLLGLSALVVVAAAVVLPVYFVVIKPHHKHSSSSASSSGTSTGGTTSTSTPGGGTGPNVVGAVTTGGDGSTVTTSTGETFVYSNKFAGYWVDDPADPFNDGASPNSWTPPLNTSWDFAKNRINGVNLGGWFVLEPFIVPDLFQAYPSAKDEWDLTTLMAADGTLQTKMENHYATFITEQDIAQIAGAGLNWVRLPIPFWAISTWTDVGVAPDGSTVSEPFLPSVAWKYIVRMLGWARKYGIRVNLDLHTIPGSQNGLNHSGKFGQINFLNGFMGVANAQRALDYVRALTEFITQPEYQNVVPMFGIMNEAKLTVIGRPQLTSYYIQAHDMIRGITGLGAGNGAYISLHDGFDGLSNWADFLQGSDRIILDSHPYFAFNGQPNTDPVDTGTDPSSAGGVWPKKACTGWAASFVKSRSAFGITLAGEWSTSINDCGLYLRGVNGTTTYGGNCADWQDASQWSAETKAGILQVALASMDAFQDWFFWTWKIGNTTSGIVESPLWSYQLGMQGGWMPIDPRTASGKCAAVGVDVAPFAGPYSAYQTGGSGAGTIVASSLSSFGQFPPATISNLPSGAMGFLPTYTATAGIQTLSYVMPAVSVTPTATPTVSVGSGWVDASDTASFVTAVAGCTYTDAWSALSLPAPTALCTGAA
ncbi:glycoside hydrolase family 5 protein [Roridomyces roridus]|uniref:glucan 1,3-beta-glucosidase n=1 Tax=Roridomyces roridus TaxID=1738132 RepID=A0AAD7BQE8_9AGAR|nr:glycoside hydrolase family 5 protein [Roridomyces roridus]